MADRAQNNLGLLVLAGIGAGTLLGASVGLFLGRRAGREADAVLTETVDDLKERAQQVLTELSQSVAHLHREEMARQSKGQDGV